MSLRWAYISCSANSAGSPGGSTGSLQYNDDTQFSGDGELKWDSGPKELKVTGSISTNAFFVNVRTPASGATYTVDSQSTRDYILSINTAFNNSILLPALATFGAGRMLLLKDQVGSASINNILVTANGTENIDEDKTLTIGTNWAAVGLYAGSSRWLIV